ncbi:hypothetical protein GCM10027612_74960 [Microbispora bryophytorum subsp. camponoti]
MRVAADLRRRPPGRATPGQGVTTALLELNGVRVFGEDRIPDAAAYLAGLVTETGSTETGSTETGDRT